MKKRFLHLLLPTVALILELLPYGAVCNFANPEGAPWRETFSYFSMTPFGYANFAPLITALLTCILLLLLIAYCIIGKQGLATAAKILLLLCIPISLAPLLYGLPFFSVVGALITLSLLAELLFLHFYHK